MRSTLSGAIGLPGVGRVGLASRALAAGGPTDDVIANVMLLAGHDGADAATAYEELSVNEQSYTFVGNAQLDTAQKKFGSSSLLLDGTGDWCTIPSSAVLHLEDGDFTMECNVRFNALPGSGIRQTFMSHYEADSNDRSFIFSQLNDGGTPKLQFHYSTDGISNTLVTNNWTPLADTWYHVAISRVGTNLRMFVDGTELGSAHNIATSNLNPSIWTIGIGVLGGNSSPSSPFNGWIDEVRITVGTGRYAANFTAPEEAYPRPDPIIRLGPDLSDLTQTEYSYFAEGGDYQGIAFNDDGSKCFVADDGANKVSVYVLGTNWDLSTKGTRTAEEWAPTSLTQPQNLVWQPGGGRLFVGDSSLSTDVLWADMSTAFDVSTAGATSSQAIAETTSITCVQFNADGTKMFIGGQEDKIWEYALSSAYDPSTKGAATVVLDTLALLGAPGYGLEFSSDGLKAYLGDAVSSKIHQYNLSVAYDFTTAVYQPTQTITGDNAAIGGLHLKPDGTALYACHASSDRILAKWEAA